MPGQISIGVGQGRDIVVMEVLLKMRAGVVLWNMRVWVGVRVGRVGFGEVGRVGWGMVGYGRLGRVFDFSIGGSFIFKRQIKYVRK